MRVPWATGSVACGISASSRTPSTEASRIARDCTSSLEPNASGAVTNGLPASCTRIRLPMILTSLTRGSSR